MSEQLEAPVSVTAELLDKLDRIARPARSVIGAHVKLRLEDYDALVAAARASLKSRENVSPVVTPALQHVLSGLSETDGVDALTLSRELRLSWEGVAHKLRLLLRLGLVARQGRGVSGDSYLWTKAAGAARPAAAPLSPEGDRKEAGLVAYEAWCAAWSRPGERHLPIPYPEFSDRERGAWAAVEQAVAERERAAVTAWLYQELGDGADQLAIDINLGKHVKEAP